MKVMVHTKGIFCEQGGLVKIKGRLFANTISGFNNKLKKEWEMFSTFQEGLFFHALHGDERPITLADGDYLYYSAFYDATLEAPGHIPADYLKIGGNLLGKYTDQIIKVEELNKDSYKTYWVRFTEGNQSVVAEFELKILDDTRTYY